MYTNEQKKKMVEYGVEKFHLDSEFLKWIIDEFNNVYTEMLKLKCEQCERPK